MNKTATKMLIYSIINKYEVGDKMLQTTIKKNNKNYEREILYYINYPDYIKGKNYYQNYLKLEYKEKESDITKYNFKVESERRIYYYDCQIEIKNNGDIAYLECNCPQFQSYKSCKHIAACLYHYQDDIFNQELSDDTLTTFTKTVLQFLGEEKIVKKVKQELTLKVNITTDSTFGYSDDIGYISLEIGLNKLYKCSNNKLSSILDAIANEEELYLGKNFSYDPEIQYFNDNDKEIIDEIQSLKELCRYSYQQLHLRRNSLKNILQRLKNTEYTLNGYKIISMEDNYPLPTILNKENDKYKLHFENIDKITVITGDLEYIQIENKLYHLSRKDRNLLMILLANDIDNLIFKKEDINMFSKNMLPTIKNNIELDETIDDIIISKEPTTKLYFDLYRDKIICNLKFKYDNLEIDYFEEKSNILRDEDYETKILEELFKYHFDINKKKLLLEDLDDIANFLEKGLLDLTERYETYTSEKLKEVNIIKKTNVSSTFSIGHDNIMSYSFDLGDIKEDEIVNIFESLKNKKKYFRLKSGDIINLEEDRDLKELQALTEDMNLKEKDIESGEGTIPKYRAIYLDSLKNNKYHIIKTNNLFKELIDKFNTYKDSKIKLNKKEKELLRDYQLEGVKWLYNINQTGFGGILADEMGLGKSIQTIYFIKELLKEDKNYKFLIVSPTSLAYNWEQEFLKFEPNIKHKVLAGLKKKRLEEENNAEKYNVLITTYGLLREDKEFYQSINFKVMIIDEAQNIKNSNTEVTKTVKSIQADTKIALTGTPIENSTVELWSIFDYIMPGFLGNIDNFGKKYKVRDFDNDTNEKLQNLNNIIKPFVLRRKKKDVIKDLPDKIENNIYVELTKEQKKIYLAELEKVNKEMQEILEGEGINKARFLILQLLTKLRQICIDPRILFTNYEGGSGKMEEFVKVVKEIVSNKHKILIFTSFKTALSLAKNELDKNNITSYTIDGSVSSKKRVELVERFNNDNTNVFFIMLKSGGTGLNLTSADVVIHLDLWWNPQAENQATDRAHRIGQKNVVEVIRFISKGTIEEKILELQNKKKILSDKLIDSGSGENSFSKLTEKDIKELLSYENRENE